MEQPTQQEIARKRSEMGEKRWAELALWDMQPGGSCQFHHETNGAAFLRQEAIAAGDNSQLAALFGKDAVGTVAVMKLLREAPAEYKKLRAQAVKAGLLVA